MNAVAKIKKALPSLSTRELQQVERALINIYRKRKEGVIFDDAYGVWTEEDQSALAGEAIALLENPKRKKSRKQ